MLSIMLFVHFLFSIQDNPAVNFYGVKCGGTESSLSECIFNSSSPIGCPSDHYVALRCCKLSFIIIVYHNVVILLLFV